MTRLRYSLVLLGAFALVLTVFPISPVTAAPPGLANPKIGDRIPDRYIVVLRDGVDPAAFAEARGINADVTYTHALNGFAANIPAAAAQALSHNPNVLLVEADAIMGIDVLPTGIDRIDVEENAVAAINGDNSTADIDVAVLDTGVDTDHPDLNVAGGAGFAGTIRGIFVTCDDGTASFEDGHDHGTHVSGTIGARDNGGNEVVGVVPGARIWGVKVLTDSGSGAISCIIDGVDWVTARGDIEVANMSLGGGNSSALCTAVNNSVNSGVVYAVAAGNSAQNAANFSPANCSGVITVSAIADFDGQPGGLDPSSVTFSSCTEDQDDSFACFSNFGTTVEVAAPGVLINSTVPGGGYALFSGTSMASPHVAGAVALFELATGYNGTANGPSVISAMTSAGWTVPQDSFCGFTGDPDSSPEPLVYAGSSCHGPVDLAPTVDITNPADGATVSGTVTVTANATDDNGVTQVEFFVNGSSIGVDNNSGDGWSANWDTTAVSDGSYTVSATATDTASQTASDSINVTVDNVTEPDDPPTVSITNPSNGATVSGSVTVTATASDDNGVTQVEFLVDGSSIGVDTNGSNGWSATWNTTSFPNDSYLVTAVATDTASQTASDAINVTVDNTVASSVHIGDLDGNSTNQGSTWTAQVTITVHDGSHNPVANATVTGSWSGPVSGSTSCTTNGAGTCTVTVGGIHKRNSSVTWTVSNVTHSSLSYDGSLNHDPDGDSNGSSINVSKP